MRFGPGAGAGQALDRPGCAPLPHHPPLLRALSCRRTQPFTEGHREAHISSGVRFNVCTGEAIVSSFIPSGPGKKAEHPLSSAQSQEREPW